MYQVKKLHKNKVYKDDQGVKWDSLDDWAVVFNDRIVTMPSGILGDMSRTLELYDTNYAASEAVAWFNKYKRQDDSIFIAE